MKAHRFALHVSEQRKLTTLSYREIDSMARTFANRRIQTAAREAEARQALRDALRRH